jgi:hypothetical protein
MSKNFILSLTPEREKDIIDKYKEGLSTKDIGEIYGFNRKVIAKWLKLNNVKIRKNGRGKINENYFEIIDTEEKAYFLGFILADGCIYAANYPSRPSSSLNLEIHEKDKYILEKLKSELQVNKKICTRKAKKCCHIRFSSNKLCQDLSKYDIVPHKTFKAKIPKLNLIPDSLKHHFFRGLFDGDGCIYSGTTKTQRKYFVFNIVGTLDVCKGINDHFKTFLTEENLNKNLLLNKNIYNIYYRKLISLKRIYNFLYKDATIFLTRKEEKFRTIFSVKYKKNFNQFNNYLPIGKPILF